MIQLQAQLSFESTTADDSLKGDALQAAEGSEPNQLLQLDSQ